MFPVLSHLPGPVAWVSGSTQGNWTWPGTLDVSTIPDPRSFHVPHCFGLFTLEIGPQTLRPEVSDRKEVWLMVEPGLLSEVPDWMIPGLPGSG